MAAALRAGPALRGTYVNVCLEVSPLEPHRAALAGAGDLGEWQEKRHCETGLSSRSARVKGVRTR